MANAAQGSRDLANLSKALKDAGRGDLRKELLRRVREAGKATLPDIRESARANLPRSGGFADRVADQVYRVAATYGASGAKVRIVAKGMKELDDIDHGRLRHPVYGNREVWVAQSIQPGFFSKTIEGRADEIRGEIGEAIDDIKKRIERSV